MRLEVTENSVRVLSRPAYNVDIAVVARTEDGLRTGVKFQVQMAGAGAAASRYNPSEIVGGRAASRPHTRVGPVRKAYVTDEIGFRPTYSSNNVYEFRAGAVTGVNLN